MYTKDEAYRQVAELTERFTEQHASYKKSDYNETLTRRDFIDPFFKALGWDVDNSQGYAEAYREVIHEDKLKIGAATKAPDYSFRLPGGKRLFFVEAKKPSVLVKDELLPAYQVRRYGWSAKLPVSLITDFEEFAVYDCTKKPNPGDKASTGRIKYITYKDYLAEFDFIWDTFSKRSVLKGSFDKFVAADTNKKGTATVDKEFLHSLDQWRMLLASNIALRNQHLAEEELNYVVQQTIDRIIFLRIAEDRKVEDYGELRQLVKGVQPEGSFYRGLYGKFTEADSKYNSGLFDFKKDTISSNISIDNKVIKTIINELYYPVCPYEFSVLGVEILGSAYEQFLGKQIKLDARHRAVIEEKPEVRKAGGVYYTPQYIVDYIVENTVGKKAPLCPPEGERWVTPEEVAQLRIVDPACGSGSFLLGAYDYLLKWHREYYKPGFTRLSEIASSNEYTTKQRNEAIKERNKLPLTPDGALNTSLKKQILLNNIYGVDLDTQAVEVTKLSLLLKCMEGETASSINAEMRFGERVLPTLDNNIKSGNSLIDLDFYDMAGSDEEAKKVRPFSWEQAFPKVFKQGGFDVVVGNPPYVRIQTIIETSPSQAEYFGIKYSSAGKGNYDLYVTFIEKSIKLLNKSGVAGLILPHKFFTAEYGVAVKNLLKEKEAIDSIVHFGHQQIFEGATTYTCILSLTAKPRKCFSFQLVEDLDLWRSSDKTFQNVISLDTLSTNGAWNFARGEAQELLEKLSVLPKLEQTTERIFQGLKTSADKIFIVNCREGDGTNYAIWCPQNEKLYSVEKCLFHPLVKGGDSLGYIFNKTNRLILFPYRNSELVSEAELRSEFPLTFKYLKDHEIYLRNRENGKMDSHKWYGYVYPKALDVMSCPKIFTPDIAPNARYSYDTTGEMFFTGGVSGGYGIRPKENISSTFLLAILNSKLLDWNLKQISTQMRGGWYSYEAKYIRHLPIADASPKMGADLEELADLMIKLKKQKQSTTLPEKLEQLNQRIQYTDDKINKLVYELYGLSEEEVKIVEGR